MPFEMPRPRAVAVRIEPSAATELSWLLFACAKRDAVLALPPDVIGWADQFWDDGLGIQPEILVLADRLGCLTGWDIAPLLHLESQRLAADPAPALATEEDVVRAVVAERLSRLRSDPALRRDFGELIRRAWGHASGTMDRLGRPTVERAVARARASLDHGVQPLDIIPTGHLARQGGFLALTEEAIAGRRLLVSPCYFAHTSGHVVDLPDAYSVAVGTGVTADAAALRSDAERIAGRLKLLADPTRLLILTVLAQGAAGVGDVAKQVGVAQPTASVHIRQLRDAGLLAAVREAGVIRYRTDVDQLHEVLSQAGEVLLPGAIDRTGSSRRSG